MFRGPTVVVRDESGADLDVSYASYTARPRADVDFLGHLPSHLCTEIPAAATVSVEWRGETSVVAC